MDKILSIVLQARDDASEKIKEVGEALLDAGKRAETMADKFKDAGWVVSAVASSGSVAILAFARSAMSAEVEMSQYEVTLRNAAEMMKTTTQLVKGNEGAIKSEYAAVQNQIEAKQLQIRQLRLADGEHKNEIRNIEREILALDQQARSIKTTTVVKDSLIQVANQSALSYEKLHDSIEKTAKAYVKLAFDDEETSKVMAKNIMITKDLAMAEKLLQAESNLARYSGISLTDAQRSLATAIQTGSMRSLRELGIELQEGADAQMIYGEVMKRVGGQADEYASKHAGVIERLKVVAQNMQEALGERILAQARPFFTMLTNLADKISNLSEPTLDLLANILILGTGLASAVGPLLLFLGTWQTTSVFIAGAITSLGSLLPVIALVAGAVWGLYQAWTNNIGGIKDIAMTVIQTVIPAVVQFGEKIANVGGRILTELIPVIQLFVPILQDMAGFLTVSMGPVLMLMSQSLGYMWAQFKSVYDILAPYLVPALKALAIVLGVMVIGSVGIVMGAILGLSEILIAIIATVGFVAQSFKNWLDDTGRRVLKVVDFFKTLIDNIKWVMSNIGVMKDNIAQSVSSIGLKMSFADGGYVPQTGGAMVHQGEYVLSRDMIGGRQSIDPSILAAISAGGGRTVTINLGGVSVNSRSDADYLVAQLSAAMR